MLLKWLRHHMENSLITYHLALSNCATTNVQSQLGLLSLKKELEYEHLGYILELLNKCKNSLDSLCFTNHQWFTLSKSTPFEYFLFYFSRNIWWCSNGFTDKTELGQLLFKLCLNFNFKSTLAYEKSHYMKQLVVCQFYLQFTGGNSNFLSRWLGQKVLVPIVIAT